MLPAGNKAFADVFATQSALGRDYTEGDDFSNYVPLKSLRVVNLPDVVPRVRPTGHLLAFVPYFFACAVSLRVFMEGIWLSRRILLILSLTLFEQARRLCLQGPIG